MEAMRPGTLALVLANAVPRSSVLFGKYMAALICVAVPLILGALLNLALIDASRHLHLGT